jgi:hypothetical protein
MASTTFAPGRTREREFDFEFTERSNRGNAGALIPVPRYKERDIKETIEIQRGPYGERERDRYVERDVYETRGPVQEERRTSIREEIDVSPPHHHKNRNAGARIRKREHTSECICLECVRARRYGEEYKASGTLTISRDYAAPAKEAVREQRERDRDRRTIGYGNYNEGFYSRTEMDVSDVIPYEPSPRNSGYLLSSQQETTRSSGMLANYSGQGSQDWTVVDVPPGTRRVTVEPGSGPTEMIWSNQEKSIRRTRGGSKSESTSQGELWTEITKDLVTAEALQEFGYQYEETEFYYYIFEYLHRDQIQELIELTKDIRRERVKDIEYYERMQDRSSVQDSRPSRPMLREQPAEYYERDRYESREVYYN